jgi:xanthine/uracil permease
MLLPLDNCSVHVDWLVDLLNPMLQILIAIVIGWIVCIILTESGVFDSATSVKDKLYYARTDARNYVITNAKWFQFPYPGEFVINICLNTYMYMYIVIVAIGST